MKIKERDQGRIADDAYIAIDALEGIMICGGERRLSPEYLREKVETAQRCLDFMKNFYGRSGSDGT